MYAVTWRCWNMNMTTWHPAPWLPLADDPYITVHIRAAGDWTTELYKKAQEIQKDMVRGASQPKLSRQSALQGC